MMDKALVSKMRSLILGVLMLLIILSPARGACVPADLGGPGSRLVFSENSRGCWVGWWCPAADPKQKWDATPYVAAALKSKCGLVGTRKAFWDWVAAPNTKALTFGLNPHTDPGLLAVWQPELAKLRAAQ